jgi:DNA-binding NtrC family response regulator
VIQIHVPPLRERIEDIPNLVEHFLAKFAGHYRVSCPPIGPDEMAWLATHSWPGNVRELRNVVERYVIRGEIGSVGAGPALWALPPTRSESRPGAASDRAPTPLE